MMNCDRIREQLPECLAGKLDKAAREIVIEHLETCSGCRAELAQLGIVWRGLESLAVLPEPNVAAMKDRFRETLAAFEAGLEQGRQNPAPAPAPRPEKRAAAGWWPLKPAWRSECSRSASGPAA